MAITAETLVELIDSTIAARLATDQSIRDLRTQLEVLENERDQLLLEEQGYRLALARRFPETSTASIPEERPSDDAGLFALADDFTTQARSDAVETAVRVITRTASAASPAEIEEFLHERGRSDSRDAIGAALAYLNRSSRVESIGRAQWRIAGSV